MRKAFLLTGLILGCMSPSVASSQAAPFAAPLYVSAPASVPPQRSDPAFTLLRSELMDLRRQGLALRASDGGTLTAEHRDYIQVRIDAAYRRYHEARP